MTEDRPDPTPPDLRQRAQERLNIPAGDVSKMAARDVESLIQELQVHQAELEVQNEDLRLAQQELAEVRDRYVGLYDFAPVGYITLDASRVVRQANQTLAEMLGIEREELIGSRLEKFAAPEDQDACYLYLGQIDLAGASPTAEFRFRRSDGTVFWVRLDAALDVAGDADAVHRVTATDISDWKRAENALLTSEERYRTLFESSRDANMTLDPPNWRFTSGNRATMEMFRMGAETQFTSLGPGDLSPAVQPDGRTSRSKAIEVIETAMREGSHFFEWRHRRFDGQEFPASVLLTRVELGERTFLQATVRDITGNKRAEELLIHRAQLDQIIAEISSEFLRRGPDEVDECIQHGLASLARFAGADRAYVFLFGDEGQLSNTHEWCAEGITSEIEGLQDIVAAEELPWFDEHIRRGAGFVVPDVSALPAEAWREREHWARQDIQSLIVAPMFQGEVLAGFVGFDAVCERRAWPDYLAGALVVIGATFAHALERKRAEVQLRRERNRAQSYLDIASAIMIALDVDGRVALINKKGCELLGCTEVDVVGQPWFDRFIPQRDRASTRAVFAGTMASETILAGHEYFENNVLTADGQERLIAWHNAYLQDGQGRIAGTLSFGQDITERRQIEEQLRHSQKMDVIGQLAGGMAHDFRNMLTVIEGFASLLLDLQQVTEEGRPKVEQILQAADRSARLTGQLLAFSRREILRPQVIEPAKLVHDLLKSIPRLIREDIRLSVRSKQGAGCVQVDPGQFQQAVINLVLNARDAMPKGGELAIGVERADLDARAAASLEETQPGPFVMVTVRDNGIGMDEGTRSHAFEPFFTTKEVGQGTGLGLSMVYGFVKQSGGAVVCDSQPGEGTTLRLYFPAVAPSDEPEPTPEQRGHVPGGSETLLLVEDEQSVRHMVATVLEKAGYTVLQANHTKAALAKLAEHQGRVDVLLTDIVMPGEDGVALARAAANLYPHIPVLYMSGYAGEELTRRGLTDVTDSVLLKPFSSRQLLGMLAEALGR